MPYQGFFYSELNRFKAQATTQTLVADIGETIYLSVFSVPNNFKLTRLRIIENGNISLDAANNIDVKILSDPGKYREAEASTPGSGEPYVILGMDTVTSESGPNIFWLYDDVFDPPLEINDNLKSNCCYVMISSAAALSDYADFTVYIEGYKIPEIYETTHEIGQARHSNKLLKVLRNDVAGDLWYSIPNTINADYNKNSSISPFVLSTDYIYFGMEETWDGLWFNINNKNTTVNIIATWEYWDGTGWPSLTIRDNCTDEETTQPTLFYNNGVVEWDIPEDWQKSEIGVSAIVSTEPPYDLPETYDTKWIPRYWIRCNIDDVSTAPTFYWIREKPLEE